jgi:hypothetical protein
VNEAQKNYFYSKHFTLKGQIYFPTILTPKANDRGVMKYSCMFAWDVNDAAQQAKVQEVGAFLESGKQQFYADIPDQHFGKPLKRFDTYLRQDGKPNHEFLKGKYWMNASATERVKPIIVFQDHKELDPLGDAAQVWSGRNCLFNFSFYGYDASGKKGIAVNIRSVMLLEGGEKMEGAATVNVGEAFGGFAADMNAPMTPVAAPPVQQQPVHQQPVQQQAAAPQFDPMTGQPIVAAAPAPQFDPVTGQPIAAQWTPGQPNNNAFNS